MPLTPHQPPRIERNASSKSRNKKQVLLKMSVKTLSSLSSIISNSTAMKHFSSLQSPLIECSRKGFLRASPASPSIRYPRDLQARAFSLFRIPQIKIFENQTPQIPRFLPPIEAIQQRILHANERKTACPKWPEHIKQIILPDTEEGRQAISEVKRHWQSGWDKDDPKGLRMSLEARRGVMDGKTPFFLVINSKATWNSIAFDGLTFHPGDEEGKTVWEIANPLPFALAEVGETLTHHSKTDIVCYSIAFFGPGDFLLLKSRKSSNNWPTTIQFYDSRSCWRLECVNCTIARAGTISCSRSRFKGDRIEIIE
jgi:hypothetical protein